MARGRGGSSARGAIRLELDADAAARLVAASRLVAGGVALRREFAEQQRKALLPTVADARGNIRSMPSRSGGKPSLRAAIARTISTSVRYTTPSAAITVGRPTLRGFRSAGFRTQDASWRHPVFGNRSTWVSQRGKPGWFMAAVDAGRSRYEEASRETLDRFASQLSRML